jgi:hypothetical protein
MIWYVKMSFTCIFQLRFFNESFFVFFYIFVHSVWDMSWSPGCEWNVVLVHMNIKSFIVLWPWYILLIKLLNGIIKLSYATTLCDKVHKQIKAVVESRDPVSGNNLKGIFLGKMFNQVLPLNLQPYNAFLPLYLERILGYWISIYE